MRHLILLFLCFNFIAVYPQDTKASRHKPSKQEKLAEKKKREQTRKAANARKDGLKRHRSIQSKDVRHKMKRNQRRYQHVDSFDRKPNFFRRIFPRRRPSGDV